MQTRHRGRETRRSHPRLGHLTKPPPTDWKDEEPYDLAIVDLEQERTHIIDGQTFRIVGAIEHSVHHYILATDRDVAHFGHGDAVTGPFNRCPASNRLAPP